MKVLIMSENFQRLRFFWKSYIYCVNDEKKTVFEARLATFENSSPGYL